MSTLPSLLKRSERPRPSVCPIPLSASRHPSQAWQTGLCFAASLLALAAVGSVAACVSSAPPSPALSEDAGVDARTPMSDATVVDASDPPSSVDARPETERDSDLDGEEDAEVSSSTDPEPERICAAPLVVCGDDCIRVDTIEHCGACDAACTPGEGVLGMRCVGGRCQIGECDTGRSSCDGDFATGCETRLDSRAHCGACNNACALDADCSDGRCVPSPVAAIAAHARGACAVTDRGAVRCWGQLPWWDAPTFSTALLPEPVPLEGEAPWSMLLDAHGVCVGTSHQVVCWSPEEERWALSSGLPAELLRADASIREHVVGPAPDAARCARFEGTWRCWSAAQPEVAYDQPWAAGETWLQGMRCEAIDGRAVCTPSGSSPLPWRLGGDGPWPLFPCVTTGCGQVPDEPLCLAGEACGASLDRVCMRGGCHRRDWVARLWGGEDTLCGWSPVGDLHAQAGRVVCFGEEGSFDAPMLVGEDLPHTLSLDAGSLADGNAAWVATPDGLRCLGWDRRLICWGESPHGAAGVLAFAEIPAASAVLTTPDARLGALVELAAGDGFLCALHASGDALCRGDNAHGQLGDGTGRSRIRFDAIDRGTCGGEPC